MSVPPPMPKSPESRPANIPMPMSGIGWGFTEFNSGLSVGKWAKPALDYCLKGSVRHSKNDLLRVETQVAEPDGRAVFVTGRLDALFRWRLAIHDHSYGHNMSANLLERLDCCEG